LELLRGAEKVTRAKRQGSVIVQAMALDAARAANGNGNGAAVHVSHGGERGARKGKGYGAKEAKAARRQATAEFLKTFSASTPTSVENGHLKGLGPLVKNG
jgi:hypothetical protein